MKQTKDRRHFLLKKIIEEHEIEKQEQLVVTDAEGDIVWLVDERPSSHCCIGGNTKKILRITWRRNV